MDNGDPNTRRDGEELPIPVQLVAALKEPPARRVFVPPAIDAALLQAARQHFTKPERTGFHFFRSWILWPMVVTACIALAGLAYFATRSTIQSRFAREDINHDGRVDILDAFQLARETQPGAKPAVAADLNHDGIVDRRDAELIATHAVKLEKGGKS